MTQTGDTKSDISEQFQTVMPDAHMRSSKCLMTGDTEAGFIAQNHTVAQDANLPFPLYSPRAQTHSCSFTDSASGEKRKAPADEAEHPAVTPSPAGLLARQTEGREEANRDEPSPFTENPSLPPALPVQEEPDTATSVVPVAAREARLTPASPEENPYPYGCAINGNPKTWTGRVVRVDEWNALSEWDRHSSTGKLWNGITRQWEADVASPEPCQGASGVLGFLPDQVFGRSGT